MLVDAVIVTAQFNKSKYSIIYKQNFRWLLGWSANSTVAKYYNPEKNAKCYLDTDHSSCNCSDIFCSMRTDTQLLKTIKHFPGNKQNRGIIPFWHQRIIKHSPKELCVSLRLRWNMFFSLLCHILEHFRRVQAGVNGLVSMGTTEPVTIFWRQVSKWNFQFQRAIQGNRAQEIIYFGTTIVKQWQEKHTSMSQ